MLSVVGAHLPKVSNGRPWMGNEYEGNFFVALDGWRAAAGAGGRHRVLMSNCT